MAISVIKIIPEETAAGDAVSSMDFLNDIANRYPDAISLAAGRPPNQYIQAHLISAYLDRFITYRSEKYTDRANAWTDIGQYAATNGIINELIAKWLQKEENLPVNGGDIVVTNGFQEALIIELLYLSSQNGAVVSLDPTYVGLTGAAMISKVPIFAVTPSDDPVESLQAGILAAKHCGYTAVAIYLIPDFDNPTGYSLDLGRRTALLELAGRHDAIVLEDIAYRLYRYDSGKVLSLLRLDSDGRVIQLGSFSKSFMPGVRVGYSVGRGNVSRTVSKSFLSVTTSPVAQAITGGFLLEADFDLERVNKQRIAFCRANRDTMLLGLSTELGDNRAISWSRPGGGFFLVVNLPFEFKADDAIAMAERYGVIVTPMSFFSPSGKCTNQVRLSFSANTNDRIHEGIIRFSRYVKERIS